ncbi:MAG: hypothetical protein R2822_18085 [Spirosomataceae bacterium]
MVLDEPRLSFTDDVMSKIVVSEEFESKPALDKLLEKSLFLNPKEEFTNKIMNQTMVESQYVFEPIISQKTWRYIIFIASILIFTAILSLFFSEKAIDNQSKFNSFFELNNFIFIETCKQSSIIFSLLISVFALLGLDFYFRKKVNSSMLV